MKTDTRKILITSAVTAAVLLLAFQPVSAFNPQPEPPDEQATPMTSQGEDKLVTPDLKPASASKGVKAKNPAPPPSLDRKPRAMEPLDKK